MMTIIPVMLVCSTIATTILVFIVLRMIACDMWKDIYGRPLAGFSAFNWFQYCCVCAYASLFHKLPHAAICGARWFFAAVWGILLAERTRKHIKQRGLVRCLWDRASSQYQCLLLRQDRRAKAKKDALTADTKRTKKRKARDDSGGEVLEITLTPARIVLVIGFMVWLFN